MQLSAPEQVAITSLSIVLRPPSREVTKGASPRHLWLATPSSLYSVQFAEDPWAHAGASYEVKFPEPVKTRCLSVVLDEAYGKGSDPDVAVTLAEVTAHTEFDGKADRAGSGRRARGGRRSRAAWRRRFSRAAAKPPTKR